MTSDDAPLHANLTAGDPAAPAIWVAVPPPPAPIGINVFAPNPPEMVCWSGSIPNQQIPRVGGVVEELVDQTLTVTGIYIPLVQATATKDTPFKQTVSITTGVSTTETTETGVAVNLGVTAGWLSIGASITTTTGHSTALSQSSTVTQEFDLVPLTAAQVSAVWWQLLLTYTITYNLIFAISGTVVESSTGLTTTFQDSTPTFVTSQYPAATAMVNRASTGLFAAADEFAPPAQ